MSDLNPSEIQSNTEGETPFGELLLQFDQRTPSQGEGARQVEGTVVAIVADGAILDIGWKTEGLLPSIAGEVPGIKPGDKVLVSVKGRGPEGYYELTRLKISQPKDWSSLESAFAEKATVLGTVTGVVKGGLTVDVGMRAFLPASRSGARDAAEMEKLVGEEIACRITKLDVAEEDLVVDRRVVLEEQARSTLERRFAEVREGETVSGVVRSMTDYGAFVDLGGVDGLLHISDLAWSRVGNPADVLSVGQQIDAMVLKIDPEKRRISLGLKQLQPQPWDSVAEKYKTGDRVRGTVTRLAEFGAFVELEPGVEGLIHLSEMSWAKKVRKPGDIVKAGDVVEVAVLALNLGERRISLGLKQALGDPWAEAMERIAVGAQVEGTVASFTTFGAFVQVAEGVEGLVHISEITLDKRLHHPQEALKLGERVKALVIGIEREKRQMRLSIKQLVPTSVDEYLREHKAGDVVTGRLIDSSDEIARVELGEGIEGACSMPGKESSSEKEISGKVDFSSLTEMLQAKWKGKTAHVATVPEPPRAGQIRSFRILSLDPVEKKIELEMVL